jgi:hypothetical protein
LWLPAQLWQLSLLKHARFYRQLAPQGLKDHADAAARDNAQRRLQLISAQNDGA